MKDNIVLEELQNGLYLGNLKHNVENCVNEANINQEISNSKTTKLVGTQTWYELGSGELYNIKKQIENTIKNKFDNLTSPYTAINWIYTQDREEDTTVYHNHSNTNLFFKENLVNPVWSWVFYVQLPKDSKSNIKFKIPNHGIYTHELKEGEVLIFKPEYEHLPNWEYNKNRPRIVTAGTIYNVLNLKNKNILI